MPTVGASEHEETAPACAKGKVADPCAAQIDATDREIDAQVYEQYGLTEEEIAVVEGRAGDTAT